MHGTDTIVRDERYLLTGRVIKAAIDVHTALGPGFVESVYQRALVVQLAAAGLGLGTEVQVPIHHLGVVVGRHEIDLLVEGTVIVELKAVSRLADIHFAQVRSYLAATGLKIGLLFNFGVFRLQTRRVFCTEERAAFLGTSASRLPAPRPSVPTYAAGATAPTPAGGP